MIYISLTGEYLNTIRALVGNKGLGRMFLQATMGICYKFSKYLLSNIDIQSAIHVPAVHNKLRTM